MTSLNETYPMICHMNITDHEEGNYTIKISCSDMATHIKYDPASRILIFPCNDSFSNLLKLNEYQLRKILHNKKNETFYIGFRLNFIIRDNHTCIRLNDLSNLVVYDKRHFNPVIFPTEYYECNFLTLYTDGSCNHKLQKCAYAIVYKKENGYYDLITGTRQFSNSSLIELVAVCEGIKTFTNEEKIRIVTDSRYVIKGLTEWVYNWKLNNWHTAQGEKVKHKKQWLEFDSLTAGKYIEFDWVKAHSFRFENNLCDKYAKELSARIIPLNVKK